MGGYCSEILERYELIERAIETFHEIFTKIEENSGVSVIYTMPKK